MVSITITITDEQEAARVAVEDALNAERAAQFGGGQAAGKTATQWAQMHVSAIAESLLVEARRYKAKAEGITSVDSLTDADIEAIKTARAK